MTHDLDALTDADLTEMCGAALSRNMPLEAFGFGQETLKRERTVIWVQHWARSIQAREMHVYSHKRAAAGWPEIEPEHEFIPVFDQADGTRSVNAGHYRSV